jgi:glutamyl-tRNA synthetase
LLRIEDLDRARCRPAYLDDLFRDLEYLGLTWDEEPVFQSRRNEAYCAAIAQLQQLGRTYECFCSRSEIARTASAPHDAADEGPRYPGTCAKLLETEAAARRSQRAPAVRFRPFAGVTQLTDRFCGAYEQDVGAVVGDFVVQRNDGVASYQLAVVVDDAHSGVTEVLRGDDLLASTPRQLQLYRALSLKVPDFAHVPLLIEPGGHRLAKREGVFAIAELRAAKVPPERVIGLLASWSGLGSEEAPAAEWVDRFSLDRVGRSAVRVDEAMVRQRLWS